MAVIASYAPVNATQIGGVAVSGTPAVNNEIIASGAAAAAWSPGLALVAATPVAGVSLINGTQALISWAVPNDGLLHRVFLQAVVDVTVAQTGGATQLSFTLPDSTAATMVPLGGGNAIGVFEFTSKSVLVKAGTTVTYNQNTAMTAGTAVLWAEMWAS